MRCGLGGCGCGCRGGGVNRVAVGCLTHVHFGQYFTHPQPSPWCIHHVWVVFLRDDRLSSGTLSGPGAAQRKRERPGCLLSPPPPPTPGFLPPGTPVLSWKGFYMATNGATNVPEVLTCRHDIKLCRRLWKSQQHCRCCNTSSSSSSVNNQLRCILQVPAMSNLFYLYFKLWGKCYNMWHDIWTLGVYVHI